MELRLVLIVLGALLWPVGCSATELSQAKALEVGVVPYSSARTMVVTYEPLRKYLAQSLARPVELYTAPGFKAFQVNSVRGDFDLIITAAHFARILEMENGYIALARFSAGGRGLITVSRDSRIQRLADLRGRKVAVPDRLSLATVISVEYMKQHGLQPSVDFQIVEVPSFNAAIQAILRGDAAAAISAPGPLAQLPEDMRNSVRTLADSGECLGLVFLAHPRLSESETARLKHQILLFGKAPEGLKFLSDTGFGGLLPVTVGGLRRIDPYVPETKRLLELMP